MYQKYLKKTKQWNPKVTRIRGQATATLKRTHESKQGTIKKECTQDLLAAE